MRQLMQQKKDGRRSRSGRAVPARPPDVAASVARFGGVTIASRGYCRNEVVDRQPRRFAVLLRPGGERDGDPCATAVLPRPDPRGTWRIQDRWPVHQGVHDSSGCYRNTRCSRKLDLNFATAPPRGARDKSGIRGRAEGQPERATSMKSLRETCDRRPLAASTRALRDRATSRLRGPMRISATRLRGLPAGCVADLRSVPWRATPRALRTWAANEERWTWVWTETASSCRVMP